MTASGARVGIPVSEILDEHETFIVAVNGIAERFRRVSFTVTSGNRTPLEACPPKR